MHSLENTLIIHNFRAHSATISFAIFFNVINNTRIELFDTDYKYNAGTTFLRGFWAPYFSLLLTNCGFSIIIKSSYLIEGCELRKNNREAKISHDNYELFNI